jgi:ketosteroid isomerase-like protein
MQRLALLLAALALAPACKKDKDEPKADSPKTAAVETPGAAQQPPAEPPAKVEPGKSADPAIAQLEGCWAAFSAWDKEKFRACYTEKTDVATVDGIPPNPMTTQQDVIVQAGSFRNAFADFKADLVLGLVNGKKAVALGLVSGTHKGGSLGIPPTGKSMSMFYAQVIELDDQLHFHQQRDYIDQATLLHQLGVQESQVSPAREEPWPEVVRASAKNDETEKKNVETFKASFEARVKGDFAASSAQYADDAVFRYIPEAQPYKGKAEIAKAAKDDAAQNTAVKGEIRDVWAAGNWVVAQTTVRGKLAVPIAGIKQTKGKAWEENALELLEFEGGKVKRHLVLANSLKFAVDLGLIDAAAMGG